MSLRCTMILGDCLDVMRSLSAKSIHMCFADLPYGLTDARSWDNPIPFDEFWKYSHLVTQPNSAIILSATGKFMPRAIASNLSNYRYDLVWHKEAPNGYLNANKMPLRRHENILVFYRKTPTYNPQKTIAKKLRRNDETPGAPSSLHGPKSEAVRKSHIWRETGLRHPGSVFFTSKEMAKRIHPTQKPTALLDWLIRTYSNPGDNVLDPVAGSGTTACAALIANRNVTCIERNEGYFEASVDRVEKVIAENNLDVTLEVRR